MNAVNMDTGYVNYLSDAEKQDVLRWTREALGEGVPFVAGAYIENQTGDIVALYRQQMDLSFAPAAFRFCFRRRDCMAHPHKRRRLSIRRCATATRTYWLSN